MINFFYIIGIWSLLTALLYWLGKRSIANLPERKLIEIISSPIFSNSQTPKHRILPFYIWILIFGGALSIVGGSIYTVKGFMFLQSYLFNRNDGIFIPHHFYLFYIVSIGLGWAILLILVLYVLRKSPPVPLEKWNEFPTIEATLGRVWSIRNFGFALSILLQGAYIFGMYDYVIVQEDRIIRNPPERFSEQRIFIKDLSKVNLTYNYKVERGNRSGKEKEVLHPKLWFFTEKDSFNIWHNTLNLNRQPIEKIAAIINTYNVLIQVNYPGVMEKQKWKKDYSNKKYHQIMAVYDNINKYNKEYDRPQEVGEPVRINNLRIQLDSAVFSNRANIFENSKREVLLVYFKVNNISADTTYFGTLSDLQIIDNQGNKYTMDMMTRNFGTSTIPPNSSSNIMRSFNVSKENKGLKVSYRPTYLNEEHIYFKIED